jgi:SAM-dependent methyltransferase
LAFLFWHNEGKGSKLMESPQYDFEQEILAALDARTVARGRIDLPCIPAACEHYLIQLNKVFKQLGKELTDPELAQLRNLLVEAATVGWQQSMGAKLCVQYEISMTPKLQKNLACNVSVSTPSLDEQYQGWLQNSTSSPFGKHADARVLDVASTLGPPEQVRVLDIGAGSGRNAVALAQKGHPVDAVESSSQMIALLQAHAESNGVPMNVMAGDFIESENIVPANHYQLAIAAEVITHFRDVEQVARFARHVCKALQPGGRLVFNIFLARKDFQPSELVRQATRLAWASLFTRGELDQALAELPLKIVSEHVTLDYERERLPSEDWPPTPWFESWSSGRSAFPSSPAPPLELRWFEYERSAD